MRSFQALQDVNQDTLDLINLLSNTNYVRLHDAMRDLPEVTKMLKKMNERERHSLLHRIQELINH